MKADSIHLFDFLGNGKTIFEIPVFQRNYEWDREQCKQLFKDLTVAAQTNTDHFIGAIVYVTETGNKMSHIYRIIDGQQRLTSLTLLLKALSVADEHDQAEIEGEYLTNKYLDDNNHLKLKPVIGKVLFTHTSLIAFIAIIVGILCWYFFFRTSLGLRMRSVGENPMAADILGINVVKYKYMGVLISGFMGGIGGAVMAQSITLNFSASTISGQGFMSLAAMIFGKWNPLGATGAALFFGLAQSLPIIGAYIPLLSHVNTVWFQIAPYAITIIVLVIFLGKAVAPAADGENYIKGK